MFEFLDYNSINIYNGRRSPQGTVECDLSTAYYMRCLYQRLYSQLVFTLPDGWNMKYFKNVLLNVGFIGVVQTEKYGVIPQICTLQGYGIYREPKRILVQQPLVQFTGTIGENCSLITLTPDYHGIVDIIEHYALQLSMAFTSVKMSEYNNRLAYVVAAKNKRSAEAVKMIYEKIMSGEPLVVTDKTLVEDDDETGNSTLFTEAFDVSRNFVTDKLLENINEIIRQFDAEVGIPAVSEKKERMITTEAEYQIADSTARLQTWAEVLNDSIAESNKLFPDSQITFKIRGGGEENVSDAEDNTDRDVRV